MAARLAKIFKQEKDGGARNKPALSHKRAKMNTLVSGARIQANHVTYLSSNEMVAMASALNIPCTGAGATDLDQVGKDIAGRLEKVSDLTNFVLNGGTSPHGIQVKSHMRVVNDNDLDHETLRTSLGMSGEQARILKKARALANLDIVMMPGTDKPQLALYFDSARAPSNWKEGAQAFVLKGRVGRNTKEIMNTALGTHGEAFAAVKGASKVFAELSKKGSCCVDMVAGHSLGGGYAQYFTAAYTSEVGAKGGKPAMVLFDPMLLNDRQAADAIKRAPHDYDYSTLRGVAITLTNPKAPAPTLLSRMRGAGFRHPGLVELKLDVQPADAADFKWGRDEKGNYLLSDGQGIPIRHRSNPSPGRLLGYHEEMSVFEMAIHRFTQKKT